MTFTVASKELKALFASPLAWLVLTVLQFILGYAFLRRLNEFLQLQPQLIRLASPPGLTETVVVPTFATAAMVLLFAVPLLAMRLVAEEQRNQTMVFLLSAPVSVTEIVVGKFIGLFAFLLIVVALLVAMPLSLAATTHLDYGLLASVTLGLTLLVASFAAVSLYVSSLTAHPMAAALGGFGLLLAMALAGDALESNLRGRLWGVPEALARVFAPLRNFEPLARGLFDTAAVACLLLLTMLFLILTVRQLDGRRVRG